MGRSRDQPRSAHCQRNKGAQPMPRRLVVAPEVLHYIEGYSYSLIGQERAKSEVRVRLPLREFQFILEVRKDAV